MTPSAAHPSVTVLASPESAVPRVDCGVVYGRFQPFHNGHLEYVRAALERCDLLFVGITNPDPAQTTFEPTDPERHLPRANPFTFFERLMMIQAALRETSIPLDRVQIVPFPVHDRARWLHYVPKDATHFRVLLSAWDAEKVRALQAQGLKVEVLPFTVKGVTASMVRARMAGGQNWRELVPAAVASDIDAIGGVDRVTHLYEAARGNLRAVLFDLRNTILRVDRAYERCAQWLYGFVRERSAGVTPERFKAAFSAADAARFREAGNVTVHDWTRMILEGCIANLGLVLEERDLDRLHAGHEDTFVETVELYGNALAVCQALRTRGLALGLVIDGTVAREARVVGRLGLREHFDAIVISEEVGLNKFTTAPFDAALKSVGCEPHQALVVGDRTDKDIVNANRLGMTSVLLRRGAALKRNQRSDDTVADFEIGTLDDLEQVVQAVDGAGGLRGSGRAA
jgi:nicotinamide-nucleotide adenylyltransferase